MTTAGVVRMFDVDQGWGVVDADGLTGGCWVHFSAIVGRGHRSLVPGQAVRLRWEAVPDQDGYHFRAVKVWPADDSIDEPPDDADEPSLDGFGTSSAAFRSTVSIVWDTPAG